MTVVVGYQWTASPREATVLPDGTVSWAGATRVIGEPDRVAIELGKEVARAVGAALVGVTVTGPAGDDPQARSAALACDLDEVALVRCTEDPDTTTTAAGLAVVVRGLEDVRAVVVGDAAADSGTRMVGPVLGGILGWPVLTDVREIAADGAHGLSVGAGPRDSICQYRVEGPAVLVAAAAAREPHPLGLRAILTARSKPSRILTGDDLGVAAPAEPAVLDRTALELGSRRGHVIAEADPDRAAAALVTELRQSGVL